MVRFQVYLNHDSRGVGLGHTQGGGETNFSIGIHREISFNLFLKTRLPNLVRKAVT